MNRLDRSAQVTETNGEASFTKKQRLKVAAILAIIVAGAGLLFAIIWIALTSREAGGDATIEHIVQYNYGLAESSTGMKLHVLRTKPSFVTLDIVDNNVTLTDNVGINGGFFHGDKLISMAVVNGRSINGSRDDYGSGGENMKYARGTLVWDGSADSLSVQVVGKASELRVRHHSRFWAQGGISMSLGDDEGWAEQAAAEHAPNPDEARLRSGVVYDDLGWLYLIVSETGGTLADFRSAIKEQVGGGRLVDGVFLDGDGSSQLLSKEAALSGDNRKVLQMMRITN